MIGHPEQAKPVWEKLKAELTFGEWRDEQLDLARTLVGLARAVAKHSLVLSAWEGVEVEDIAFLFGDRAPGTLRKHLSGWRRWASYCQGVRFNEIPDKVPKVPEKVGEGLVQSQVRSNRVPEKVAEKVRRFRDALVQSQVKFNRVPKQVPEKVPGGFGAEESLRGFGAEPGLGGFGAEPDQVEQGSGEGSGEASGRLWCRAMSGSTGFRKSFWRRFREALLQSQVRFNRFRREGSGENSGEGLGGFGAARSGSTGFRRRFGRLWCRARSGSTGFGEGFGEGVGSFGAEPGWV